MISLFDVIKNETEILSSSMLTVTVLFLICLLWGFGVSIKPIYKKLPPSPPWIPLLGSVPFLTKAAEKKFQQWSNQYGSSILYVKMGDHWSIVLNTYEAIEEVRQNVAQVFI